MRKKITAFLLTCLLLSAAPLAGAAQYQLPRYGGVDLNFETMIARSSLLSQDELDDDGEYDAWNGEKEECPGCDAEDDAFVPMEDDSLSAAVGKVTKPDWWSVVAYRFPRNSTATVHDIRTGLSYRIKRMGGNSHADTEPLTVQDTAIMYRIYGGAWSWNRRAIIVEVNGEYFAASQNGMPHGQQTIYDNSYDGQFCIHFLNSKTHGGNAVCPQHQAAIADAYKYGNTPKKN